MSGCEETSEEVTPELELIGYGTIQINGTIQESSGNFTVNYLGPGEYRIIWNGSLTTSLYEHIITVTPIAVITRSVVIMTYSGGSEIGIEIFQQNKVNIDCDFNFTVYKIN